jgi:hypothetical protein
MKKILQIIDFVVQGNTTVSVTARLRNEYERCTGFFLLSAFDTSNLTLDMKIASREIIPAGTNAQIFQFFATSPVKDVTYDLSDDSVPARSSNVEVYFNNAGGTAVGGQLYFILENN